MRTSITDHELLHTMKQLYAMRQATPWYRFIDKFRFDVMISTFSEIIRWIGDQPDKRSCGCAAHTNHYTN